VLLREANGKYTAKDLMGALKLYEDVLNQVRCRSRSACMTAAAVCGLQKTACRMHSAALLWQRAAGRASAAGSEQQNKAAGVATFVGTSHAIVSRFPEVYAIEQIIRILETR
jgi:hypothetical protein